MKRKQILKGEVVASSCNKTIRVLVRALELNKHYNKLVKSSKNYLVHDEYNRCNVGDQVVIQSCRPLSKRKAFELKERCL